MCVCVCVCVCVLVTNSFSIKAAMCVINSVNFLLRISICNTISMLTIGLSECADNQSTLDSQCFTCPKSSMHHQSLKYAAMVLSEHV